MNTTQLLTDLNNIGGCGDGYCIVTGKAKGQHTNGGCRCSTDRIKMQRLGLALQRFLILNNLTVPRNL